MTDQPGLPLDQIIQGIGASNSLVAAGAIEGSEGKYAVKVPALIETPEDVANLPVVAGPNAVVRVRDLAAGRVHVPEGGGHGPAESVE